MHPLAGWNKFVDIFRRQHKVYNVYILRPLLFTEYINGISNVKIKIFSDDSKLQKNLK